MATDFRVKGENRQAREAISLYRAERFDEALAAAESLNADYQQLRDYMIGLILELGLCSRGTDLEAANLAFGRLALAFNDDEGFQGLGRTFIAMGRPERAATPLEEANQLGNAYAPLLLGELCESRDEVRAALRHYWRAAFRGAPWGLRRAAFLHWRVGNYLRSAGLHVLATLVFPVVTVFKGTSAWRKA